MLRSMSGLLVSQFRYNSKACREFAAAAIIKPQPQQQPTTMIFPRWTQQRVRVRVVPPTNNTLIVGQDPILSAMLKYRPETEHAPESESLQALNRNARKGKRANKGARPCSRIARRAKKRANGNWRR
jgi:hypothetical protein